MKQERNLNIELLRIISMLMIIILHFQLHGGVIKNLNSASLIENYPVFLIEAICIIAVNIYVLITGYYMVDKEFKLIKVRNIALKTLFYSIIIGIILWSLRLVTFDFENVVKVFLPIITGQYWFINAYLILLLLGPYLNKLIKNMTFKEHRVLLIILLIINSVMPIYLKNTVALNTGNSVFWFINLYLIAGYLKRYQVKIKTYKLWLLDILSILITALLATICYNKFGFNAAMHIYKYNLIFVLLPSLVLFLLVINIKRKYGKTTSKIITFFASSTLAVYLISDNSLIRYILWNDIINANKYVGTYFYLFHVLIIAVVIFIGCVLIDKIVNFVISKICKRR